MRRRKDLFVILLLTFISSAKGRSQYVRCFQRLDRKSIDNYQPIAEFFYLSPHQCIDQCILATNNAIKVGLCKSFVYNHLQHSCRLYDHAGNQIPAIIHPANGYDFYKRTATTQECAGPLQRFFTQNIKHKEDDDFISAKSAQPIQQISPPIQFGNTQDWMPKKLDSPNAPSKQSLKDFDLSDNGAPAARPQEFSGNGQKSEIHKDEESPKSISNTEKYGVNFKIGSKNQLSEAPSTPKGLKLPPSLRPAMEYTRPCTTSTGFYLANGNEMLVPQDLMAPTSTIIDIDQQKCLNYCASNTNALNQTVKCLTLNYLPNTKTCTLYGILAQPHGQGKLIENLENNYAEKFCLPKHEGRCQSNAIFELKSDKRLTKNVIASTSSQTLAHCLQSCLNTENCRCASFDSKQKQCLFHDLCAATNEKSDKSWIIINNGCQKETLTSPQIVQQTSEEEWSPWTLCRYKLGSKQSIRIRTRKCNPVCAEGGNLQIERCNL